VPLDLPANGRPGSAAGALENGLNDLNLSAFYDVIDTFSRRRYFFRKRLSVFQISDSELGVHKRGIVGAVATVFS
jgi:hypothetical protein